MRWIPFLIAAYVATLVQTTLASELRLHGLGVGSVGPDLLAVVAVFVALHVRSTADAMLAGWVLGMALDLTAAGGPGGTTALGPLAIVYVLAAGGVHRVREALFRERIGTQALLGLTFCAVTHGAAASVQALLALGSMTWAFYGQMLLQVLANSAYTAVLTPVGCWGLRRIQPLLMTAPARGFGRR